MSRLLSIGILRCLVYIRESFYDTGYDTGKIMPMLIKFTIPLVLGNLFQITYNAVDSIIVGHFIGKEALAAVGICNPITTLVILSFEWALHGCKHFNWYAVRSKGLRYTFQTD